MAAGHRLQIYWAGRDEGRDSLAERLQRWLASLAHAYQELAPWYGCAKDGTQHEVQSRDACVKALEQRLVDWEAGGRKLRSYQPRLVLRQSASHGELTLRCGIPTLEPKSVFVPNQLVLELPYDAVYSHVDGVRHLLAEAVSIFEADFGHVGSKHLPAPALPVFSPGVPPVGWMTFLGARYPASPPLPRDVIEHPIARGRIIVAIQTAFDDLNSEHRDRVEAVRRVLTDGGVLLSAAQLAGQ